jgi:hypothetical protein
VSTAVDERAGDAGDGDDEEDRVNPENLRTNFFGINLAAPEWGVGWANPTDARGVSSVIGMSIGRLPPAVGIAGELGWIVGSGSLNGGLGSAVVAGVEEIELGEGGM